MRAVGPFLKWAGGKARLAPQVAERAPPRIQRYHEPFLGGGAVFFALLAEGRIDGATLADGNADLIETWQTVRDDVEKLIRHLRDHARQYERREWSRRGQYYYEVRDRLRPRSSAGRAARLIFLNKTCFNGLYRVNRDGRFNVPHGRHHNPRILDREGLRDAAAALACASIEAIDFADACARAEPGDFVYLDPPYQPLSDTSVFTEYTKGGFGIDEQRRLRDAFDDLTKRGVPALLSNSEHPVIRELYSRYDNITPVPMGRNINANVAGRAPITELLISNGVGERATARCR